MSVTLVKLHSAGASGSASGSADVGADKLSYRSQYRVYVDDPLDSPITIFKHFQKTASLPWPGRPFRFGNGFDAQTFCKSIDPQYVEGSGGQYTVSCSFESSAKKDDEQGQNPEGQPASDPTSWHDDIEVSFTQISIPVEQAYFRGFVPNNIQNNDMKPGKFGPVTNSANVPFDPPLEEVLDIKVIRISKYFRNYDGAAASRYQGAVNNDNVTIVKSRYKFRESFRRYQGRINSLSASFQILNRFPVYRQTIEVHIHPSGWRRFVVDRGIARRACPGDPDGNGGTISLGEVGKPSNAAITDEEGYPMTEPVLLNGNGQPLRCGSNAVYLEYQTRNELPFGPIRW